MKLIELNAPRLPMDQESRLKRAGEMGFTTKAFHGTNKDFREFRHGDIGYHFGTNEQAWERLRSKGMSKLSGPVGGEHIMPVLLKITKPLEMEDVGDWEVPANVIDGLFDSTEFMGTVDNDDVTVLKEIRESIGWPDDEAAIHEIRLMIKKYGYDSIRYENTSEGAGTSYIVFDSSQVRSIFAEFDPAKKSSGGLNEVD